MSDPLAPPPPAPVTPGEWWWYVDYPDYVAPWPDRWDDDGDPVAPCGRVGAGDIAPAAVDTVLGATVCRRCAEYVQQQHSPRRRTR
jgi:hypothetical protein